MALPRAVLIRAVVIVCRWSSSCPRTASRRTMAGEVRLANADTLASLHAPSHVLRLCQQEGGEEVSRLTASFNGARSTCTERGPGDGGG